MTKKGISLDQTLKDKNVSVKIFFLFTFLWLLTINLVGQPYAEYPYPVGVFRNPLGIDWKLAGTFGEPRGNHFHGGDDIKTNGATGYKLFAIEDGYVSRIKVSPFGYGNALYILHPNGYTSVYGHMSKFNDKINSIVKEKQYNTQQFSQDIYLSRDEIKVLKDEIIGFSGNSGGSSGPHLHFEIRESASEQTINPLFFGYQVADNIPPSLFAVKVTTIPNNKSYYDVSGKRYDLIKTEKGYSILDTINVAEGKLGIGVHGYDRQTETTNKNGIFRMELFVDDQNHFTWTMDKMSFDEGRYVNALRDFYENKNGKTVYNCFKLPGNNLSVYEYQVDNGFINVSPNQVIKVNVVAWDFHQNKSNIEFYVRCKPELIENLIVDSTATLVRYNQNSSVEKEGFKAYITNGTFYDDVQVTYLREINTKSNVYSDYHQLHNQQVPMHKSAVIQIEPKNLPPELKYKVVMMHKDLKGVEQALTTFWKDDMIAAKCNEVGTFYAKIDTNGPNINVLNFTSKTQTFRGEQIRLKITDNLSGIDTYNGYIDEKWVLFEYDAKRNALTYEYDEKCTNGAHKLKITVTDGNKNSSTKEFSFIR